MSQAKNKPHRLAKRHTGFTLIELLVIGAIVLLAGVILLLAIQHKETARRIRCTNNLKQIGIAFKIWGLDARDGFPMQSEAESGGSLEAVATGEVFRHFQVLSNELSTPKLLVCPGDNRAVARDFGRGFSNTNISYFVGVDAFDAYPQMLLVGDRNLTNGPLLPNHLLVLRTNSLPGWTRHLHDRCGNIGLADASVQGVDTAGLRALLRLSGVTNRLAMP